MKLLFVEDEELDRIVLERMAKDLDAQIAYANGTQEALAMIERERPDLVVTDLLMPDCCVADAVAEFTELGLPVVALTGVVPGEAVCTSTAAGAIDVLFKGDPPAVNLARIKKAIALIESRKNLAAMRGQAC